MISLTFADSKDNKNNSPKVEFLLENASDYSFENRDERAKALEDLKKIQSSDDIRYLVNELGTKNTGKKSVLIDVLTHIGKPAVPILAKAIKNKDDKSAVVIYILGTIGDDAPKRKIRKYLDDSDVSIKKAAAFAVGKLKDDRASKKLIELLKDPMDSIRMTAVKSLGMIGDKKSLPDLVECLDDPIFTVRFAASEEILKFKEDAKPELKKFLNREIPPHIRFLADKTLKTLEDGNG
ncbi:HEAT repeat domain-containing protein [bacterium]|nr:HEAT repeat domain-containing protein [bacterium]